MSTLKVTNIQATGETATRAVSGVAAAWVNFNGTGTAAIRDSVNVASLTDNSTGQYAINFTNDTATVGYSAVCGASSGGATNSDTFVNAITFAVGSCTIQCATSGTGNTYADRTLISSAIHGDLA
jgi:hypothetical protein